MITKEALKKMAFYKDQIKKVQERYNEAFSINITQPLDDFEVLLRSGNLHDSLNCLVKINSNFHNSLPFTTLEELEDVMNDKNKLII